MRNSVFFFCVSFVVLVYVVGDLLFGSNRSVERITRNESHVPLVDARVVNDFGVELLVGEIEVEGQGEESLDVGVVEVKHQLEDLSSEVMELHIDQTYLGGL